MSFPKPPAETYLTPGPDDIADQEAGDLAHLDPIETPPHFDGGTLSTHELALQEAARPDFARSGQQPTIVKTAKAFILAGVSNRRLWRFVQCGKETVLLQNEAEPHRFKIARRYCRDRFCPRCQAERAALIRAAASEKMLNRTCRFITLTLKSSDSPLSDQIERLWRSFAKLRRTKSWKATQKGGIATLEITLNPETRRWHPHLHVIVEGSFIPQAELKRAWHKATADSFVLSVMLIRNPTEVAQYVAHYATKLTDANTTRDRTRFADAIIALAKRKTVAAFGTWTKLGIFHRPKDHTWRCLGTLDYLAINGCPTLSPWLIQTAVSLAHSELADAASYEFSVPRQHLALLLNEQPP